MGCRQFAGSLQVWCIRFVLRGAPSLSLLPLPFLSCLPISLSLDEGIGIDKAKQHCQSVKMIENPLAGAEIRRPKDEIRRESTRNP